MTTISLMEKANQPIVTVFRQANQTALALNEEDEITTRALLAVVTRRGGNYHLGSKRFVLPRRLRVEDVEKLLAACGVSCRVIDGEAAVDKADSKVEVTGAEGPVEESVTFGRYRGEKWCQLPNRYLEWVKTNMQGPHRQLALKELNYRKAMGKHIGYRERARGADLPPKVTIPGIYQGRSWSDVPEDYLEKITQLFDDEQRWYAQVELERRKLEWE